MKVAKPKKDANTPHGLFFVVLLAVILAVLFGKSFLPSYVHFSNDGPLGQQNTSWSQLPAAFTGTWWDLNGIGSNAGSYSLDLTALIRWTLGAVGCAKFLAPAALFILGFGAWTFFRQLKLSALAATLGALAATLNSTFFASTCWGVASQEIAIGMDFFALALVASNSPATPALIRWARLALAGLAVGMNVIEAADIGAILSVFVAAVVFFKAVTDETGPALIKFGRGVGRVAMIAIFAGFIATQTIVSLVGSQITGIAGTAQDAETKGQHWDWATQWSLPKKETLSLFMPGLFGYKMDTPNNMPDFLQDAYKGGTYWGGMGRDPVLDRFFDSGGQGTPPPYNFMRQTGGQNYAGILVVLIAIWAIAQSFRRKDSVFTNTQCKYIWFWAAILIGAVLLAWGRFAPFDYYKHTIYALPYFSTIRNPAKFILVFSVTVVTLFAYGVHGLSQRYLAVSALGSNSISTQLKNWWARVSGFDRKWTYSCAATSVASLLGWLVYASEKPALVHNLQITGFPDEEMARQIAGFSIAQAGWFVPLFAAGAGLCILIIAGVFSGRRAKLGGLLLGILLVVDLGRANLPYIIHWDYKQKYASNPIIDFLRDKPYEHRVIGLLFPPPQHLPFLDDYWGDLYRIEWAQHHFPYYNIQSLDLIQRPRVPADEAAYETALIPHSVDTYYLMARRWQLTNTRYLLGPAGFLDVLNEQFDPLQHRFRIIQRFDVLAKPGIQQITSLEEMTAIPSDDGACALFEFNGALPRARLYSDWQISTNDSAALKTLASTSVDPQQQVLVSTPLPTAPVVNATNENSGLVEFKRYVPDDPVFSGKRNGLWKQSGYCYAPKDVMFDAKATPPSVLLLNDKFDPHWQVFVDGKPAELLRCNFIMRGVYLTPGAHLVEFKFTLPNKPLYVSLAAIVFGVLLSGCLLVWQRRATSSRPNGT